MVSLSTVIRRTGLTKQRFAEITQIPYYRIAMILYGQDCLTSYEKSKITGVFGKPIFLP